MRAKLLIAVFACALGALGGRLIGRQPAPAVAEVPHTSATEPIPQARLALAPPPRAVVRKSAYIPLSEVHSTSGQRELAGYPAFGTDAVSNAFRHVEVAARSCGTSNVFVLSADNVGEFVSTLSATLTSTYPPEVVWRRGVPEGTPLNLWLVAILRPSHSTPHAWEVESVEAEGPRVRFTYRRTPNLLASTGDVHAYIYWCKLPESHHDVYTLELFNDDRKSVELRRECAIVRPPRRPPLPLHLLEDK
jgi:hypothetical protein